MFGKQLGKIGLLTLKSDLTSSISFLYFQSLVLDLFKAEPFGLITTQRHLSEYFWLLIRAGCLHRASSHLCLPGSSSAKLVRRSLRAGQLFTSNLVCVMPLLL